MLRRFLGACCAFVVLLVLLPLAFPLVPVSAQNASPVAVESKPDDFEDSVESGGDFESVESADLSGNTPADNNPANPIYALVPAVYLYFAQVTTTGNSTASEGALTDPNSFVSGYRTDNARLFEISTTAGYEPNIKVCIYFGPGLFVEPLSADLFRFDVGGWTTITAQRDSETICGYTTELGTFVVAEPGVTPTSAPTETSTLVPTETTISTPTHTSTSIPTETTISTPTHTSTSIPTETTTSTPTHTSTSIPIETTTPTPTHTSTSIPTQTPTISNTPTELPTDIPSATPTPTFTGTSTPTMIPSNTPSPSPSSTPTVMNTLTATPTPATGKTQFALPNVWVIFSEQPVSGTTQGAVLDGTALPPLSSFYRAESAWFVTISTTVVLTTNKQLCVLFDARRFFDSTSVVLLHRQDASWTSLSGQILIDLDDTQGTICGYTPALGDFALVERLASTATPTPSPSRAMTPTLTPSNTPTAVSTATPTPIEFTSTPSATVTPSPTSSPLPTSTPTPSSTSTATATMTPSSTATATLEPGSYPAGTTLRATTRVNLRVSASTKSRSLGVVASNAVVEVTGGSIFAGGRYWIPVSAPGMGSGWIAGDYLVPTIAVTPTSTSTSPSIVWSPTATPSIPIATRPPGGFITGDPVQTTANLNLRAGPNTSSKVLVVLPNGSTGRITGTGIRSGSNTFYPVLFDGHPAGYVAGNYLRLTTMPPIPTRTVSPTPTFAGVPVRFTTSNVNMRSGPGTGNRIVTTLPKETRVNIIGNPQRNGGYDWYPVAVYGIGAGWVAGKFLSATGPIQN